MQTRIPIHSDLNLSEPGCEPQSRGRGFVLIEVITTLILIGVIGAFAGFFLWKGIDGFIASKRNSEVALKAQIAVDRISAELRHVTQIVAWTPGGSPPSFTYRCSDLEGTRRLIFYRTANIREIRISINGGPERVIIDELDTYSIGWGANNIDSPPGDTSQELTSLFVEFKLQDVGRTFRVFVFPRHFVPIPP